MVISDRVSLEIFDIFESRAVFGLHLINVAPVQTGTGSSAIPTPQVNS